MSNIIAGHLSSSIDSAVSELRSGNLVAIPTETVYGLAAIASNRLAISKIFSLKGRPTNHPLILHIAEIGDLEVWAKNISTSAMNLAKTFWPGPLTLVLDRTSKVSVEVTGGRETVAIRCPSHPVTRELLKKLSDAVVAPSANRFGRVSPTCAQHVLDDLGVDAPLILDGGECTIGLESTIIDCSSEPFQLLRSGAITASQIWDACEIKIIAGSGDSRASGMLNKHYAPRCRVVLVDDLLSAQKTRNSLSTGHTNVRILEAQDDLVTYAHSLYASLRQADIDEVDVLIAVRSPQSGLGIAINERLEKAANSAD